MADANCRLLLCTGCPRPPHVATLAQLTAAAKKAAKKQGLELEVARASCLSACGTGPTALVETEAGVLRLRGVVSAERLAQVVAAAPQLLSPEPVGEQWQDTVLSRLLWAELDEA